MILRVVISSVSTLQRRSGKRWYSRKGNGATGLKAFTARSSVAPKLLSKCARNPHDESPHLTHLLVPSSPSPFVTLQIQNADDVLITPLEKFRKEQIGAAKVGRPPTRAISR